MIEGELRTAVRILSRKGLIFSISPAGATFALGATSFEFKKEIPIMAKFIVENSLLGYDKKWVSRNHAREVAALCACISRLPLLSGEK